MHELKEKFWIYHLTVTHVCGHQQDYVFGSEQFALQQVPRYEQFKCPECDEFIAHLRSATDIVSHWPEWKKICLGGGKPHVN